MPGVVIEVCVENTDGLIAAQRAGADRVELCASLLEGGLTPSWGMVEEARRLATIPSTSSSGRAAATFSTPTSSSPPCWPM